MKNFFLILSVCILCSCNKNDGNQVTESFIPPKSCSCFEQAFGNNPECPGFPASVTECPPEAHYFSPPVNGYVAVIPSTGEYLTEEQFWVYTFDVLNCLEDERNPLPSGGTIECNNQFVFSFTDMLNSTCIFNNEHVWRDFGGSGEDITEVIRMGSLSDILNFIHCTLSLPDILQNFQACISEELGYTCADGTFIPAETFDHIDFEISETDGVTMNLIVCLPEGCVKLPD